MSYGYTLEENDDWRVRIINDEDGDEPYDDGQSPLLRIDPCNYGAAFVDKGNSRPHEEDDAIINAVRYWRTDPSDCRWRLFVKYLRSYFGVTEIETYWSDSYWYVTYNSKAWRKSIGFDGVIAPEDDDNPAKPSMDEYKAWINGEVYGWVVERRVEWKPVNVPADDDVTMTTWETVDSLWGFYGDSDDLRNSAREALTASQQETS